MAIYRRDIRQIAKAPASTNKAPAKKMELPVLLMMCSDEELRQFIIHYAKEQPGIHDALQDYLLPGQQSAGYPDYHKQVKELLKTARNEGDYRKRDGNSLDRVVGELNSLIWKAERYAEVFRYKEALDIALAVMEQIALSVDDIYDHDGELVYACNEAESVVDEIIRSDIPASLLETVVTRLKELHRIATFEAYGLADIGFLLLFTTLQTADADTALKLLADAIKEENNPYRCTEMVKTMLRILQKEGRTEAYWKTVDKYQFLPDIMKIRFDWLATKKDWSAILAMLDRSIVLAEQAPGG